MVVDLNWRCLGRDGSMRDAIWHATRKCRRMVSKAESTDSRTRQRNDRHCAFLAGGGRVYNQWPRARARGGGGNHRRYECDQPLVQLVVRTSRARSGPLRMLISPHAQAAHRGANADCAYQAQRSTISSAESATSISNCRGVNCQNLGSRPSWTGRPCAALSPRSSEPITSGKRQKNSKTTIAPTITSSVCPNLIRVFYSKNRSPLTRFRVRFSSGGELLRIFVNSSRVAWEMRHDGRLRGEWTLKAGSSPDRTQL